MEYTDEQIEDAVKSIYPQSVGEFDRYYDGRMAPKIKEFKLIMRMVREEMGSVMSYSEHRIKLHGGGSTLPEFWKEPKNPAAESQWRPIETEPKDRNVIFLAFSDRPEANGVRGFWAAEEKYTPIYGGRFASQPTHWMPIPELPK